MIEWHSNQPNRKEIYQCYYKYAKHTMCKTPHLTEEEIIKAFNKALGMLLENKDEVYENALILADMLQDTRKLEKEAEKHFAKSQELSKKVEDLANANSARKFLSDELRQEYADAAKAYEKAFAEYEKTAVKIKSQKTKASLVRKAAGLLRDSADLATFPCKRDFITLVEQIEIHSKDNIVVKFRTGVEFVVEGK